MVRTELPRIVRLLVVSDAASVNNAVDRLCESFVEDRYVVRRQSGPAGLGDGSARDAFDAILLDLRPVLQAGITKTEGVVAAAATQGPVVVITGPLDHPTEQSLKRAGAADCLFEDEITPRGLRRSIRYVIAAGGAQKRGLPRLFDSGTGLATQFLFWEILGLAARRAKRNKDFFALLLVEVGDLPQDGGDSIGDLVMQIAAERSSSVLRASDTVSRFEHHQLAILVESMPRVEDIQIVAEKIMQELSKPFPLGDIQRHFQANLGIALYPTSAENADMLIGKAFEALASAKGRGRDQFVFA
jgi:diguanylate cyclase (GGDEF)-like protein